MNEKELLEDFEINPLTIAVLPMEYGGKLYSKVYQLDEELLYPIQTVRSDQKRLYYILL